MTSDTSKEMSLVDRLRRNATSVDCLNDPYPEILLEAADEIERLQREVSELRAGFGGEAYTELVHTERRLRAALESLLRELVLDYSSMPSYDVYQVTKGEVRGRARPQRTGTSGGSEVTQERTDALRLLIDLAAEFPEQRICQLIVNACGSDPFYTEDSMLLAQLQHLRVLFRGRTARALPPSAGEQPW